MALDPAIRTGVFHDDWQAVDYIVLSPGLNEGTLSSLGNTVTLEALHHAHLVKRWDSDRGTEQYHKYQFAELWKVDKVGATEATLQSRSAAYLNTRFERAGAYPDATGTVTSEAQAYALLRAVWSDDRAAFERDWAWTGTHLSTADGLLSWRWKDGAVVDANTAADADTDTALALLLAGQRWNDPALREAGTRMVRAIWAREVVMVRGMPYLTAGNWAGKAEVVALNPSYFAPYAYQIFHDVDPEHDWTGVIDSSYRVLFATSSESLGGSASTGLPPDWIGLDRNAPAGASGLVPLQLGDDKGDTLRYSYDAPRTFWRIALHLRWNGDGRAAAYLSKTGFLQDEVTRLFADGSTRKGRVSAAYERDGRVAREAPSVVGTAGALAALLTRDPATANILYAGQLVGGARTVNGGLAWGDPTDLYAQEWGWFAVALYADALPNLWSGAAAPTTPAATTSATP